jgi:hypothetical protein
VILKWRGGRREAPKPAAPRQAAGDVYDDLDLEPDTVEDPEPASEPPPTSGPVLLSLTTREQVEKAAAAEAAPKMVRVRPGRGAFGGQASGGGCANPNR